MRERALVAFCVVWALGCGARTDLGLRGGGPGTAEGGSGPPPPGGSDAAVPVEAAPPCEAGTIDVAYALGDDSTLYRYDPQSGQASALGPLACGNDNTPWTMTATTEHAYVVYTDWTMYVVDLATLVCTPTPFEFGQLGMDVEFGVAAVGAGAGERIYYYGEPAGGGGPFLAVSDTQSFSLTMVGDVSPAPPSEGGFPVNLTADGTGRLYAYSPLGLVQQIDASSGKVLASVDTGVTSPSTWATIASAAALFLWADTEVVGYDLGTRKRTSDLQVGVAAIGASAVSGCAF